MDENKPVIEAKVIPIKQEDKIQVSRTLADIMKDYTNLCARLGDITIKKRDSSAAHETAKKLVSDHEENLNTLEEQLKKIDQELESLKKEAQELGNKA